MVKSGHKKKMASEVNETRGAVFYNPVQEFNRDISIAVIREFSKIRQEELAAKNKDFKGISVLECLAATGLRSVRYCKEIDTISELVANDLDPKAVELMNDNFKFNDVDLKVASTENRDAIHLLNEYRAQSKFFDVVDLDPYGSANPFLESAIHAVGNGGLLCVTFTDMAVLCARRPHVCSYKYGSVPLPNKYCHEFALRMVLHMISSMASRVGKVIEPQLSLTVDFYIRLFIRFKDSPIGCHSSILKYSSVYQCIDCESFWLQPMGREIETVHKKDKTTGHVKKYKK